jgi:hypothetical protein
MPSLTDTIEALLWEDESATLDFKQTQYPFATANDDQKSEIIKDVLAFANAFRRDDAYVLLGVQEQPGGRATILGVTNHLDDASLQQLVNTKTNRPVEFSYHALTIDGQQIGAIRIPRQQRPTYLRKPYGKLQSQAVYVRHGSSTSIASPEEIARMGTDQQPSDQRYNPEIMVLSELQQLAWFYQHAFTLIEDISRIPRSHLTTSTHLTINQPPEYEQERRALHVRYNADQSTFDQGMNRARHLLTEQQANTTPTNATALGEILDAMREVSYTVKRLASWANDRLSTIDTTSIPGDMKLDAEEAARTLSTLVAQRLFTLGIPTAP